MTDQSQSRVKLFHVQVLLPEALNWTTLSIIAETHWAARHCAEHFGIVGLAFEVPINPQPFDDYEEGIFHQNSHRAAGVVPATGPVATSRKPQMTKKSKEGDQTDPNVDVSTDLGPVYIDPIEAKITEALAAAQAEFGRELSDAEVQSIRDHVRKEHNEAVAEDDEKARLAFSTAVFDEGGPSANRLLQTLYKKHVLSWIDVKHILGD